VTPQRAAEEEEVARVYADALRKSKHPSWFWADINSAIIERWSLSALDRIKRRAWQIASKSR